MHCHCGTNNRAPRLTFMDPCKPEMRPGAREESASPAWLAASAMNACDTTKLYIWRLDTRCGPTLYRKCHSHNTPGKRNNNTLVEPFVKVKMDKYENSLVNTNRTRTLDCILIKLDTLLIFGSRAKGQSQLWHPVKPCRHGTTTSFCWPDCKANPVYEMVPSVCLSVHLHQQFGLALAFNFIVPRPWLITL